MEHRRIGVCVLLFDTVHESSRSTFLQAIEILADQTVDLFARQNLKTDKNILFLFGEHIQQTLSRLHFAIFRPLLGAYSEYSNRSDRAHKLHGINRTYRLKFLHVLLMFRYAEDSARSTFWKTLFAHLIGALS